MIKVLFFAQLREVLNCSNLTIESTPETLGDLRQLLCEKGDTWDEWLGSDKALAAVNQTMADDDVKLNDGNDVAFFPPVTGG
ncbi:molybdopterin synthase sulfur carrier subunit [Alteromonadaceae bacterium M269]|nr:molybdopterin synthase sulfur carrier subunit [Alteromonadaceae bacterium M269]